VIDPHAPAPPGAPPPWGGVQGQARLPVRQGTGRFLVLAGVFVCAACGLVYELELVALASYLIGDSVTQASVVLSVMVFAMGIGSLAAKRLRWHAAAGFGAVEAALALIGGCSAMALYAVFAWTGDWGGLWANGPRCLLVGFSPTASVQEWFLLIGILLLFTLAFSWIAAIMGLLAKTVEAVQWISFVFVFPLTFASSAFVPTKGMPDVLRAFAENQPVTHVIEAMRSLMVGTPMGDHATLAVIWCTGITIVCIPIASYMFRKHSTK